jgi:hypothetical protein
MIALHPDVVLVSIDASASHQALVNCGLPVDWQLSEPDLSQAENTVHVHAAASKLAADIPYGLLFELCERSIAGVEELAPELFESASADVAEARLALPNQTSGISPPQRLDSPPQHQQQQQQQRGGSSPKQSFFAKLRRDRSGSGSIGKGLAAVVSASTAPALSSASSQLRSTSPHSSPSSSRRPMPASSAAAAGGSGATDFASPSSGGGRATTPTPNGSVSSSDPRRLVFAGRSLSGCVATLAALHARYLLDTGNTPLAVAAVTFSAPNCVAFDLVDHVRAVEGPHFSYVNICSDSDATVAIFNTAFIASQLTCVQPNAQLTRFVQLAALLPQDPSVLQDLLELKPDVEAVVSHAATAKDRSLFFTPLGLHVFCGSALSLSRAGSVMHRRGASLRSGRFNNNSSNINININNAVSTPPGTPTSFQAAALPFPASPLGGATAAAATTGSTAAAAASAAAAAAGAASFWCDDDETRITHQVNAVPWQPACARLNTLMLPWHAAIGQNARFKVSTCDVVALQLGPTIESCKALVLPEAVSLILTGSNLEPLSSAPCVPIELLQAGTTASVEGKSPLIILADTAGDLTGEVMVSVTSCSQHEARLLIQSNLVRFLLVLISIGSCFDPILVAPFVLIPHCLLLLLFRIHCMCFRRRGIVSSSSSLLLLLSSSSCFSTSTPFNFNVNFSSPFTSFHLF